MLFAKNHNDAFEFVYKLRTKYVFGMYNCDALYLLHVNEVLTVTIIIVIAAKITTMHLNLSTSYVQNTFLGCIIAMRYICCTLTKY